MSIIPGHRSPLFNVANFDPAFGPVTVSAGSNWGSNYTHVIRIASSALAKTGSQARVTLRSNSNVLPNFTAYIGLRAGAGDAYDAASLSQLLISGSGAAISLDTAADTVFDPISLTVDGTTDIIISLQHTAIGGTTTGPGTGVVSNISAYYKNASEASTADKATGTYTDFSATDSGFCFRLLEVS